MISRKATDSSGVDHASNRLMPALTRQRHKHCVERCVAAVDIAVRTLDNDLVLASEELRTAARELGALTGRVIDVEEVLDTVFRDFCIGK